MAVDSSVVVTWDIRVDALLRLVLVELALARRDYLVFTDII